MDLFDQIQQELEANSQAAKQVYTNVREEFYEWKRKYVEKEWRKIFQSAGSSSGAQTRILMPPDTFEGPEIDDDEGDDEDENTLFIRSWTYDENGNVEAEKIPVQVSRAHEYTEQYPRHPPYRFVTPCLRSVWARPIDLTRAPFLPFPDDPTFPHDEYLRAFEEYQWDNDELDPDEELIQYEVVRRLHCNLGFTAEEIAAVDGIPPLRLSNSNGLLWAASQRDAPKVVWGDGQSSAKKPPLPKFFAQETTAATDLFAQVNKGRRNFCFNLNCIHDYCHIHVSPEWEEYKTSEFRSRIDEARITSAAMFDQPGDPCGEDCFRHIHRDEMEDESSADSALVCSVLKLDPDMLPCDLARLCRLRCRQSFFLRRQLVNDPQVLSDDEETRNSDEEQHMTFGPTKALTVTPCDHAGPCSAAVGCPCFNEKTYCERECLCSPYCKRRWQGCNHTCGRPITTQYTHCKRGTICACRAVGRECDPEKCTACDARDLHIHHPDEGVQAGRAVPCHNMDLQRGQYKTFAIRRSKYGLGAFATEKLRKNDPIGDYVGELFDNDDINCQPMEIVHKHTKLNYLFALGRTNVDAQWLGNPTRFLNDAKPRPSNCQADDLTVNGEKRIVIYAGDSIKEGTELTLGYGEDYWGEQGEEPPKKAPKKRKGKKKESYRGEQEAEDSEPQQSRTRRKPKVKRTRT